MKPFTYTGTKQKEISFPLGGIGTGCIGLAGDGRLIDWEIYNRPNKGSWNGFSHFAVRAESKGDLLDARILHGNLQPPYSGNSHQYHYRGFGFGPYRETLVGLPHCEETIFTGTFPYAHIEYREKKFPGRVSLTAFNPFIPMDAKNSGIPAAFFEFEIKNTTRKTITYSLVGVLGNPLPKNQINQHLRKQSASLLHLTTDGLAKDSPAYGDLVLATDAPETSFQQYWFRSQWFDALEVYWRDLTTPGRFRNRIYNAPTPNALGNDQALLAAHITIEPGKTERVRFVISWNFPTCENYWTPDAAEKAAKAGIPARWKNYYATQWPSAMDSALYALRHWEELDARTAQFHDALFSSQLPPVVLEAVSANISILKTPTILRLEDGTFYGFEGCHSTAGCCEGTCTHVWNYAQALPFLFPALERTIREADYRFNQQPNGGMPFRLPLPLGLHNPGGRSCADGLFGNVLTVYRDWKISGDTDWLRSLWPAVKKSIEFTWHPDNEDRWDPEKTGVLWGRQHHTLDMELFGPSAWLCGFYLAALKAAAEMAAHLADHNTAQEYLKIFARGSKWVESNLFNGEYYDQDIDIRDPRILKKFNAMDPYWDAEHGEIKYQVDEGCVIDQVLAQYHANLYGLGEIFRPDHVTKALRALFRNNFLRSMRDVYNPCRLYAVNDEAGMIICSWPRGRRKPAIPLTYAQESMHGFEYAAAVQMIQNGMLREGLAIIQSIRDRYDGEKRNPWNEMECGSHYARSMASYALLNAFSGFTFDMVREQIGFHPVQQLPVFRTFWALHTAWGKFTQKNNSAEIRILWGEITLKSVSLTLPARCRTISVIAAEKSIPHTRKGSTLFFEDKILLRENQSIQIRWSKK